MAYPMQAKCYGRLGGSTLPESAINTYFIIIILSEHQSILGLNDKRQPIIFDAKNNE
jgi:hypothetical protein